MIEFYKLHVIDVLEENYKAMNPERNYVGQKWWGSHVWELLPSLIKHRLKKIDIEIKSKFQTSTQDARSSSDDNKGCRVLFPWRGREMLVANLR